MKEADIRQNSPQNTLVKHSRHSAGLAAKKKKTCMPYNRDINRYRSKLKKTSTPLKKLGKIIQR